MGTVNWYTIGMQMFGLISLMVVMVIAAWWMIGMGSAPSASEDGEIATSSQSSTSARPNYRDSLDAAQEAASIIGD